MSSATGPTPRKILLTGSAGAIGRCVGPALVERGHNVRGFDLVPDPHLVDHVVGDLTDAAALDRAMAGRNTLIHLAAYPNPAPFLETLLQPNVVGLYQTVDAAKRHGLSRLILASSIHVVTGLRRPRPRNNTPNNATDARPEPHLCTGEDAAPINDYGLTKLWAEQLGAMTARTTDIQVLAVRLGWFVRNANEAHRIAEHPNAQPIYLSHADTQHFFIRAVEADLTGLPDNFAALFANGPPPPGQPAQTDLEPARRWLGFDPQDAYPQGLDQIAANA